MPISIREAFGQKLNIPNIPISSNRLNKILKSTSLEEATSMGLIDRLFDRFFRNGGKRETITRLYEQVASVDAPSLENMPELKMGLRFNMLRQLANEEYRKEFETEVIKSSSGAWSFSFKVGNDVIYQSDWLSRMKMENEDCFQALCALKITQNFENDLYCLGADLNDKNHLIQTRIDLMSVDPDRCKYHNLCPEDLEFRADFPKNSQLSTEDYTKLAQLCSSDLMTEKDTRLISMAGPHKHELIQLLATDTDGLNGDGLDTLKSMLSLSVGEMKTTLCKLFKMEEPQRFPSFVHDLLDEVSLDQVS